MMTRKNFPTFAHEVTLNVLDSLSQTINPASNLLGELLPSIFSRPVGFLTSLCILDFVLRKCGWTREQKGQKDRRVRRDGSGDEGTKISSEGQPVLLAAEARRW